MKLFETFRQKWRSRGERDAFQPDRTTDGAPAESGGPTLSGGQSERLRLLTPRERELFLLLLEGYTLKESAKQLSVKYSTANTHVTGIYKKLGVNSRAELIIRYRDAVRKNG